MIKTDKLCKVFSTDEVETHALTNVNFTVKKGEFVAVMGPSGCGKSTLLNIIGLLDNPTSGSYMLLGHEVAGLRESGRTKFRKGRIGFVFQSFNLIDELTVEQNVELPLTYLGLPAAERRRRVERMLERVRISHRRKHLPAQLSGGQQQRVAVARALVTEPELILADEPTGNLDSKNGREVMELLSELNADGTTIVMVTHSERDAAYAHRIVNLFDGCIISEVTCG
ncbi:MAG: ABC transporter ATP-binding protein [Muribaculaceae bacterium]|nr:ABC transporter ATP-binding protein [Muribaculaceae bacterium]